MLNFDNNHKYADISQIRKKTSKIKGSGKIMLLGVALSAVLLLSGCDKTKSNSNSYDNNSNASYEENYDFKKSAVIIENGNAIIVDVYEYDAFSDHDIIHLDTLNGDCIVVGANDVKIIHGENAHEKAEEFAENLISENGKITYYNDFESYELNK